MPGERDEFSDQMFAIQIVTRRAPGGGTGADVVVVDQLLVGGRPPGLYGAAHKSHLSPWHGFTDMVRSEVVGQTPANALENVIELCAYIGTLPGHRYGELLRDVPYAYLKKSLTWQSTLGKMDEALERTPLESDFGYEPSEKDRSTAKRVKWTPASGSSSSSSSSSSSTSDSTMSGPISGDGGAGVEEDVEVPPAMAKDLSPAAWYAKAQEHLKKALTRARSMPAVDNDSIVVELQRVIVALLHLRNTVPLTAIDMPLPGGPRPKSTRTTRVEEAALLAEEEELAIQPKEELTAALWDVFDTRAVWHAADSDPKRLLDPRKFGTGTASLETLPAHAIADHILSMELTYPLCCKATDFRGTALAGVDKVRGEEVELAAKLVAEHHAKPVTRPRRVLRLAPPEGYVDRYERFAVQLTFTPARKVFGLYVGDRPRSIKGRHSTAWVALCDYTRALLTGKSITSIGARLNQQRDVINEIAVGVGLTGPALLVHRSDDSDTLADAQLRVAEFLADLNALPGSIVDTGDNADSDAEQRARDRARNGEGGIESLIGLFDSRTISAVLTSTTPAVIALRIALHFHFTITAYVNHPEIHGLATEAGLAAVLQPTGIGSTAAHNVGTRTLRALRAEPYDPALYLAAIQAAAAEEPGTGAKSKGKRKGDGDKEWTEDQGW
ncbi:hypothetical protein [Actinomadura sp. NTSP31]|uniref:hypothetical protein n=1 Tax=Actinomadura sp. NTSP31 TaxID=1735447 RepID=UPI0035BFBCD9